MGTGRSTYLLREVKSTTKRSFLYFFGTNPAGEHTSDVSLGPILLIIPCFTRLSNSCCAWAFMCMGIDLGLNLYKEGSNLFDNACLNFIFIGGHFKNRDGLRVSLKSCLKSRMKLCSYLLFFLISSSSSTFVSGSVLSNPSSESESSLSLLTELQVSS